MLAGGWTPLVGSTHPRSVRRIIVLTLVALVTSPTLSRGDESAPILRKVVLSVGAGVTPGGFGGKYAYRWSGRGPTVAAGVGLVGYGLELGFPVHRATPTRELFLYTGVLRLQNLFGLPFTSEFEEGSHIFVIGLGPRLWPDQNHRAYIAGGGELILSNEAGRWWTIALEAGVGL